MNIYKKYKLKKDLPDLPAGTILYWDLWEERYTELVYVGRSKPRANFTKEYLDQHLEWFEPIGKTESLQVKFPADFSTEHFYFGELRHNKMCRFCFDAQSVLDSKEYKLAVTKVFRELYEKKINPLLKQEER